MRHLPLRMSVHVVNSSLMHFERGKKHTSYFLQPFCCCFHAQGTTLASGSSFSCVFTYIAEQFPCSKKLEEFRRLHYFMKKNWHLAYVMPCSCSIPPIFWGNLPETNQLVSSENMPQSAPRKWSIFQAIGIWAKNVTPLKTWINPRKLPVFEVWQSPFVLKTVPFWGDIRCFFGGLVWDCFRKGNFAISPGRPGIKMNNLTGNHHDFQLSNGSR